MNKKDGIDVSHWLWPSKLSGQRNKKDCLICCLEFITGIPYEEIPPFYKLDKETWSKEYKKWLGEKGYIRICIDVSKDKFERIHFPTARTEDFKFFFLAIFKKEENEFAHSAIVEETEDEFRIYDPLGSKSLYGLDDLIGFEFLIKKGE